MPQRRSTNVSPSSEEKPYFLSLTHHYFLRLVLCGSHKGRLYKLEK